MDTLIPSVGPWFWFILAAVLLFGELMMPGIFLMWLGLAAVATGLVDIGLNLDWRVEVVAFALLSLAMVAVTWKWVSRQWQPESDQPNLNQRHVSYIGRGFTLEQPITGGRGKLKIDDTIWDVEGSDAPAGTRVTVTAVNGMRLVVS